MPGASRPSITAGVTNRGGDNSGVFYGCRAVVTPEREKKGRMGGGSRSAENRPSPLQRRTATALSFRTAKNAPTVCVSGRPRSRAYAVARCGDSINLAFPDSKTRRGRVGKDRAGTLETSCNQGTPFAGWRPRSAGLRPVSAGGCKALVMKCLTGRGRSTATISSTGRRETL